MKPSAVKMMPRMKVADWQEDETPILISSTVGRAKAFIGFIMHEHIPYDDSGIAMGAFIRDVEDGVRRNEEAGGRSSAADSKAAKQEAGPVVSSFPDRVGVTGFESED